MTKKITLITLIFLFLTLILINPVSGYKLTYINSTIQKTDSNYIATFNVIPYVNIIGMQMSVKYDPELIEVISIEQGNLFGENTIFNKGIIDSLNGSIINIYETIIGKRNVIAPNVFVKIHFNYIGNKEFSFDVHNIKIIDSNGISVSYMYKKEIFYPQLLYSSVTPKEISLISPKETTLITQSSQQPITLNSSQVTPQKINTSIYKKFNLYTIYYPGYYIQDYYVSMINVDTEPLIINTINTTNAINKSNNNNTYNNIIFKYLLNDNVTI